MTGVTQAHDKKPPRREGERGVERETRVLYAIRRYQAQI
jgi:hypothetical protein